MLIECTGVPDVVLEAMRKVGPSGIACLTGVSSGGHSNRVDAGALNRELVLENSVVFGTVNANRRHWEQAARALAGADPEWLADLINRRVPGGSYRDAFDKREGEVKVVLEF